jgi:hypothetical protein
MSKLFLSPFGRFAWAHLLTGFPISFFKLHGASFNHRIRYANIKKLFNIEIDANNAFLVVSSSLSTLLPFRLPFHSPSPSPPFPLHFLSVPFRST